MEHIREILNNLKPSQYQISIIEENMGDLSKVNPCEYCGGSGYIHPIIDEVVDYSKVIPCVCIRDDLDRKKREILLRTCELPPMADKMGFSNFKVYPETKSAYLFAKRIASDAGGLYWVTFQGGNDTGKTHLVISICKEWIKNGIASKYTFVPLLLDELREGFKNENNDYDTRFKRICNIPLLILDDLGAESSTPWVNEKLETIVDYRYMNKLSLIVTTNKTIEELSPRLGSRLVRHPNAQIISTGVIEYTTRRIE